MDVLAPAVVVSLQQPVAVLMSVLVDCLFYHVDVTAPVTVEACLHADVRAPAIVSVFRCHHTEAFCQQSKCLPADAGVVCPDAVVTLNICVRLHCNHLSCEFT